MIFLMIYYAYLNFRFFGEKYDFRKLKLCRKQNAAMFLIHFLGFYSLYLSRGEEEILVFYGAQVLFFGLYLVLSRLFYRNISRLLLNNMCLLLSIGFLMLARLDMEQARRQFVIAAAAAVVTWLIPLLRGQDDPGAGAGEPAAGGVCEDQLCVFCGHHVLPLHGF